MKRMLQIAALFLGFANVRAQDAEHFVAYLYGANVVPPAASRAFGSAGVTLDGTTVGFSPSFALTTDGALPSSIGIYGPAGRGTNGALVAEWQLSELESPEGDWLGYYGEHLLTGEQAMALRAGLLYALAKSPSFPDGELRGQICPLTPDSDCDFDGVPNGIDLCPETPLGETAQANGCSIAESQTFEYVTYINAANVVPPTDSRGTAEGSFTLKGNLFTYFVVNPVPGGVAPTRIAIFGPAGRGTNGPLIVELVSHRWVPPLDGVGGAVFYEGTHALRPEQIAELNAGLWYVLLESEAYPNGEIRGQIVAAGSDSDRDGVPDSEDQCPNTHGGSVVNENGCSIEQLCPCEKRWRNHAEYFNCVRKRAKGFSEAGLLTERQKHRLLVEAAKSNCGRRR